MAGRWIASLLLLASLNVFAFPKVPDTDQTPGGICTEKDKDFSGYRYKERIPYCKRNVSKGFRKSIYKAYGIPESCQHLYTIDHFNPLSMGGNNSQDNLWPEHRAVKALRQDLELETFERLRDGEINRQEALDIISDAKLNPPIKDLTPGNPCATDFKAGPQCVVF